MKLKGWLLGSVCGLMSLLACDAQPTPTLSVGLTGGLNAGLIKNQGGNKTLLGRYTAGLTAERRLSTAIRFTGQLVYSQQGERVTLRSYSLFTGNTTEEQWIHLDYLSVPLLLRMQPKGGRLFMEAGGQIGYLIGNRLWLASQSGQLRRVEHTQPLDVGLTGGLGYRVGKHLVLESRCYYGLKSILRDYTRVDPLTGGVSWVAPDAWYNRVWSLTLGYCF